MPVHPGPLPQEREKHPRCLGIFLLRVAALPHADLRRLLQGTAVLALALLVGSEACGQEGGAVAGTVVSTWDGTPLPSVAVSVRGTTLATQTDASGKYELKNVPSGDQVVRFSKSGFA